MARKPNTKPCRVVVDASLRNEQCEAVGNDGYGLCHRHAEAWRCANRDLKCDFQGCNNFLYRPGSGQPISRAWTINKVTYRRCNKHMHTFLTWTPEIHERNLERFGQWIAPKDTGCWHYTKPMGMNPRYGGFTPEGSKVDEWLAHRVSYCLFVGPIGRDHQIDHRCRNPRCVRIDHLESVTETVNQQRRSKGKAMKPLHKNWSPAAFDFADRFDLHTMLGLAPQPASSVDEGGLRPPQSLVRAQSPAASL